MKIQKVIQVANCRTNINKTRRQKLVEVLISDGAKQITIFIFSSDSKLLSTEKCDKTLVSGIKCSWCVEMKKVKNDHRNQKN